MDGLSRGAGVALKKALPIERRLKNGGMATAVEHHGKATA
jgi:hypothetical protein